MQFGSLYVEHFCAHGMPGRRSPGPAHLVSIIDCPRQFSTRVDLDLEDFERPVGAVPTDVTYPVWQAIAPLREWIHDDFGNLIATR